MAVQMAPPPVKDWVAVVDFGAQYSQLIARRVRECQVYCELWPHTTPLADLIARRPKGVILSGGPAASQSGDYARGLLAVGLPVLGICDGMLLMARTTGGEVEPADQGEYGQARLKILDRGDLFASVMEEPDGGVACLMSHGQRVVMAPPGFEVIARTAATPIAAMRNRQKRLFAVQFHPEVVHTPQGSTVLRNFVVDICGCQPEWSMGNYVDVAVEEIRRQVGDAQVLCALSGGVDSAVAAALVQKAVGEQLTCIFVDHGLMRKGEPEQVRATFSARMGGRFHSVDAGERFLSKLEGVSDPETKRKLIGEEFIRVFEEEARKIGQVRYLVQGTVYPDVIESGVGAASVIKSHHNVGGLPERMHLDLIEPLRQLFKDEVRQLGLELGLPPAVVWRQPFPGPGLAIRITGPITRERVEVARKVNAIVVEEIENAGLGREVWQYFAVVTDTRSVGVREDQRHYGHVVAVRAVDAQDAMTADWSRLPYDLLDRIASRMMNEVEHVSRVVYDISSKPPATIEWE